MRLFSDALTRRSCSIRCDCRALRTRDVSSPTAARLRIARHQRSSNRVFFSGNAMVPKKLGATLGVGRYDDLDFPWTGAETDDVKTPSAVIAVSIARLPDMVRPWLPN